MSRRRHKKRTTTEVEKLQKELQAEFAGHGREVTFRVNEGEKMSEVIEKYVEPYLQYADTSAAYQRLIATAIIAWNAALVKGTERQQFLEKTFRAIALEDKQTREDFYAIVREMIQRKERHFAQNQRYVVNYHVAETPAGMHLSVASLIE